MKKNHLFLITLLVVFAVVIAACTRSASTPAAPEATFPIPDEGTTSVTEELFLNSTATAMADEALVAPIVEPVTEETGSSEPLVEPEETAAPPVEPAATPQPVAPQTFGVPDTYTLQAGEFPYCIARRFDINAGSLLAVNGLNVNSVVYPGRVLTIPKDAGPFDGQRALRTHGSYVIQAGDTLYSIACLYGDVDPRAIEAANNLTGAYSLNVGATLIIP